MERIEIKPIFGVDTEAELIGDGKIILKLETKYIETITSYKYHGYIDTYNKELGKKDLIVHESSFMKKEFISNIGLGFDNTAGRYYISITFQDKNNYFNVADFTQGKEILGTLTQWWLF
jgi:hypothetical protein